MITMINKKIIFLPAIALMIASCNLNMNSGRIINPVTIQKEVDLSKGFDIQIKISDLAQKGFKTKAASNSSAIPGKTFADIKSFSAFLTTDYNDPFAPGSNPKGNGVIVNVNVTTTGSALINISNVPVGGPYFAVVAAFDDVVGGASRDNITVPDSTICNNPSVSCSSSDISWSRTSNNVTVSPSGSIIFNGGGSQLLANLNLLGGVPDTIGAVVTLVDGNTNLNPIQGAAQN